MEMTKRRGLGFAIAAAVTAFALAFSLAGCSGGQKEASDQKSDAQAEASATRTFTDSLGREVELPAQIDRAAASGPLAQNVLLTIAPEKMVGLATKIADDQAKYLGSEYASLDVFGQIYGSKGDFNKEAVAAADPQVVIDVGEAKDGMKDDLDALQEQIGIPVVHIAASLDSYDKAYTMLGELLGTTDRAKELAGYCKKAYDETTSVMAGIPESERANVLYCVGDSGLNIIAKGAYQGGVVDMCANNIGVVEKATGSGTGNEVSFEQIANWNPSVILFATNGKDAGDFYESAGSDPTWASLEAIQSGSYYQVPKTPYNWLSSPPSVNQVLGMQWLPRVLYPDKFSTSTTDVAKDYYKTFYGYDLTDADIAELMAHAVPSK